MLLLGLKCQASFVFEAKKAYERNKSDNSKKRLLMEPIKFS